MSVRVNANTIAICLWMDGCARNVSEMTEGCNVSPPVNWIREANRRWSMALSSMGHSQASAQSLQSIAGDADRKISFVLHEPENESEGSSNATVSASFGSHFIRL